MLAQKISLANLVNEKDLPSHSHLKAPALDVEADSNCQDSELDLKFYLVLITSFGSSKITVQISVKKVLPIIILSYFLLIAKCWLGQLNFLR